MTTRRTFMAGLLGTAATGAAQACPAQPATLFPMVEYGLGFTITPDGPPLPVGPPFSPMPPTAGLANADYWAALQRGLRT